MDEVFGRITKLLSNQPESVLRSRVVHMQEIMSKLQVGASSYLHLHLVSRLFVVHYCFYLSMCIKVFILFVVLFFCCFLYCFLLFSVLFFTYFHPVFVRDCFVSLARRMLPSPEFPGSLVMEHDYMLACN